MYCEKKAIEICEKIKTVLDQKRRRQKELAEHLNISEAAMSRMLSGRQNLTIETICKIEIVLETTIIIVNK